MRHPAFPDAVTLDELVADRQYCVVNSPHNGNDHQGLERTITVNRVYTDMFITSKPDGSPIVIGGPAFKFVWDDPVSDPELSSELPFYASEMGVIPAENGHWADGYLRAGHC